MFLAPEEIIRLIKQAFLAGDIGTFNQRLLDIHDTPMVPMSDFSSDFRNLRLQQQEYLDAGNTTEANKINDKIVDFLAFFNGIIITQDPEPFVDLFSDDNKTIFQKSTKTQSLTLPVALSAANKEPVEVATFTGAYSKDELIEFFSLLQSNLDQR